MKMGSAATEDAYCLKWNDFHTSITASFSDLRNESDLLDAVVVCEGQQLQAHRLVLSACSGVFRQLFRMSTVTKTDNPVVLLWDVKADDLKLLINFMYEGQVNVAQERLSTFLALAERLQVRGLTTSDKNNGAPHPPTTNNRSSGASPAKTPMQTPATGRRLRSSPMGVSGSGMPSASKRHRPHLVDASDDLDDDLPPVKQELKVDENSVFTAPTPTTPGPEPAFAAGNSSAGSSFSPFYGGSNQGDGFDGSGSAGPSSMQEGFGLEPGQMIEEGSKEYSECIQKGTCPYCTKYFRHRWNVMRHIEDVHHEEVTPCPTCGKEFSSKSKMLRHFQKRCKQKNGDDSILDSR